MAKNKSSSQKVAVPSNAGLTPISESGDKNKPLTQDEFWPLWEQFLKSGDVVLAETGTSSFGILDVKFPSKSDLVSQVRSRAPTP